MPRFFIILSGLIPLFATILVLRHFDLQTGLIEVSSLPLSWPFAIQPELERTQHVYDVVEDGRSPLDAITFTDDDDPPPSPVSAEESTVPGQFTRRIVAVGDLHGDSPNAHTVLQMAGVVDASGDWTGAVDVFVQTGDIIDRGDDTIKLFLWMDRLRDQAHAVGGEVMSHLGNHEWMNVIGDWRYVYPSEIATFGSVAARQKMLSTGRIGKSWSANYTTTSRLPLHPALGAPNTDFDPTSTFSRTSPLSHAAISFVHGGLAPNYPDLTPFPSRINELGQALLRKLQRRTPPPPHPPHPYPGLPADATDAEKGLYDGSSGPLWYRGWALEPEDKACSAVDDVLQRTGTRRMVMGHTPDFHMRRENHHYRHRYFARVWRRVVGAFNHVYPNTASG
ncbi:Metallo-dependent phosphatase [Amylocystis lapponica]|nr:Metallo-dependent phosphatase [Amylocystis lapponica]